MYLREYEKYKRLYFNPKEYLLEDGPEIDDTLTNNEIEFIEADDFEDDVGNQGAFEGFVSPKNDILFDNNPQDIVDVGFFGSVRGRIINDDFHVIFVTLYQTPSTNKVLVINTRQSFDDFTDAYGYIDNNTLYIKWDDVSTKYSGFYLQGISTGDRDKITPFKDSSYDSWIKNDHIPIDKIILFKIIEDYVYKKKIKTPFKGYIVDYNLIDKNLFVKIDSKIINNNILVLDDIKSMDKFTNKFGVLKDNIFTLNWNQIHYYYNGFIIDNNDDIKKDRYNVSFYRDKEYDGWWSYYDIIDNLVYLFK